MFGKSTICITEPNSDDCTEILQDESKSILMGIIAQLGKGVDLHRVTLPTFVLEPRSMLERITDFMSHPDLLLKANSQSDPVERFLGVVQYFLSGWHIKPKGVKKPYNPVLGEVFKCRWDHGSRGYYIAEQVSHHPPRSAYYYGNPECGIYIQGEVSPHGKFLGNSAATIMQGGSRIVLTHHNDEQYHITMPNVYAKVGKMVLELGDQCKVHCPDTDLVCDLDFKQKGFFSGQANSVTGKIKRVSSQTLLYEITGTWTDQIMIKPAKKDAPRTLFFDVATTPLVTINILPEPDQDPNESRRLWSSVTSAILVNDLDKATEYKSVLEEEQRNQAKERKQEQWHPRYFSYQGDRFEFIHHARINPKDPVDAEKQLIQAIFTHHQQQLLPL